MSTVDETHSEEPRQTHHWLRRLSVRVVLLGIGFALFVAAGITGAMITLTWLI